MTYTRKEFEQFVLDNMRTDAPNFINERRFAEKSWQACQSLNDKRIQQLLAVIELQRNALQFYADGGHWDYNDTLTKESYLNDKGERATEALAIKPEDVELVEVGEADFDKPAGTVNLDIYNIDFDGLHKLYTIKTKE